MRLREAKDKTTPVDRARQQRAAELDHRAVVREIAAKMGLEADPLGEAEDALCNFLNGHGLDNAYESLVVLEERLLFHGIAAPDENMMEHIFFLHMLKDYLLDMREAEKERNKSKRVNPVRGN